MGKKMGMLLNLFGLILALFVMYTCSLPVILKLFEGMGFGDVLIIVIGSLAISSMLIALINKEFGLGLFRFTRNRIKTEGFGIDI